MATTWLETAGDTAEKGSDIINFIIRLAGAAKGINGERLVEMVLGEICGRSYAETLSDMSCGKGLNHQSAAETLSLIIQIWKCSESINGFEPEGL